VRSAFRLGAVNGYVVVDEQVGEDMVPITIRKKT
jgi:hypothetical protein